MPPLTIRMRVVLMTLLVAFLLVSGWLAGAGGLLATTRSLERMIDGRFIPAGDLARMLYLASDSRASAHALLPGAEAGTAPGAAAGDSVETINRNVEAMALALRRVRERVTQDEHATQLARLADAQARFVGDALIPLADAVRAANRDRARELLAARVTPLYRAFRAEAEALQSRLAASAEDERKQAERTFHLVLIVCAIGGGIGLLVVGLSGWLLVRSILRSLDGGISVARAVAKGDLTQHIEATGRDETRALFDAIAHMHERLNSSLAHVRAATGDVHRVAAEIADGNLNLSSRTEAQASSLEQTAASMEGLTETVRQNADSARQASQLATESSEVASRGGEVVSQVVGTMNAITESSQRIVDIIGVIDGIAFQTNILALNAAVEAARAGAHGRSFAVVATEVRNLAQRSALAAKEISALIGDSVDRIRHGGALVTEAGKRMSEILASTKQVAAIMSDITRASQDQSLNIGQVNAAITQMDRFTQQNATLVENAGAAAESLQRQVQRLDRALGFFQVSEAALADHITDAGREPAGREIAPVETPGTVHSRGIASLAA